jgi:hypothetical protein
VAALLVELFASAAAEVAVVAGLPVLVCLQANKLLSLMLLNHRTVPSASVRWS